MQMTVGKKKDRKVFNAGWYSGTAPKRADGRPARPVDSGMAKPQTWRSHLLPDTDADWT